MAGALRPGGSRRLAYLIHRYGEAIRADLADRGWDLARLFQDRRFAFLLSVIDQLPRHSRFVAALADDEELAEQTPETKPSVHPPLTEWSPEVERLTGIYDRMGELITAVNNTVAKKARRPPRPAPRPQTARDRIKAKRRRYKHELVLKRLTQAREEGRPTMAAAAQADPRHAAVRPRRRQPPVKE